MSTLKTLNMNYNKINNLLGWFCAIIATAVYVITAERTTSWWDCGQCNASADYMQILLQAGATLCLLIQNVFSDRAFGDRTQIGFWVDVGFAVSSGLTIMFSFWTITALGRKIIAGPKNLVSAL